MQLGRRGRSCGQEDTREGHGRPRAPGGPEGNGDPSSPHPVLAFFFWLPKNPENVLLGVCGWGQGTLGPKK
jgi:hypothetical protein